MFYKNFLNKLRIFDHLWISTYPISLLDSPSNIIRYKWIRKKNLLRMSFAFISTFIILFGAELSSPDYSFTTSLYNEILKESELINAVSGGSGPQYFKGSSLKTIIFFLASFLIYLNFLFNDPLSDTELLRKIITPNNSNKNKKLRYIHKWMNEIHFYAKHCPSNLLPNRCAECRTQGCANRLSSSDQRKLSRWNTIFANLPPHIICDLSLISHRCRLIFYIRYSALFSTVLLVFIYCITRIFEYEMNINVNYANISLISYIIIVLVSYFIVGFFHSPNIIGSRGVWGHFKENVEMILEKQTYKEIFDQYVCKHDKKDFFYTENHTLRTIPQGKIYGSEIQALLTSMKFIDEITRIEILRILSDNDYRRNDKDHLRNTITALIEMLITLNQNKYRFRGALLTPNNNEEDYLTPLVTVPFPGQPFLSYRDPEYFYENLSKQSEAIAVQAWQKMYTVSASGEEIPTFHQEQSEYLRSIIAIPLIADQEIQNIFLKKNISLPNVIGVLCIDCDNENIFSKPNKSLNELIIAQFVNRLLYQILFSINPE